MRAVCEMRDRIFKMFKILARTTILFGNVREHFMNYAHAMRCLVVPVRADECPMA